MGGWSLTPFCMHKGRGGPENRFHYLDFPLADDVHWVGQVHIAEVRGGPPGCVGGGVGVASSCFISHITVLFHPSFTTFFFVTFHILAVLASVSYPCCFFCFYLASSPFFWHRALQKAKPSLGVISVGRSCAGNRMPPPHPPARPCPHSLRLPQSTISRVGDQGLGSSSKF